MSRTRERITKERLDELRRTVPHAAISDLGDLPEGATPELIEDLGAYFNHFAKPTAEGNPCIVCGSWNSGFEWGLQHGHGHCSTCGWPAVAYHFITDRQTSQTRRIVAVLQCHPDDIEIEEPT